MLIEYVLYRDNIHIICFMKNYRKPIVDFAYYLNTNKLTNLCKSSPSVVLEYLNELGIKPIVV